MTRAGGDALAGLGGDADFSRSGLSAQVADPETSAPADDETGLTLGEAEPGSGENAEDRQAEAAGRSPRAGRLGVAGWLRWMWRQLTSMRTALILLFLLALASVPGSVLPQEGIDPAAVSQYYTAHPALAPLLNRLSLFSVFAAPWFAAIYILLFASLAGCVLPRTFRLVGSARQKPPRAPRNLARLPFADSYETSMQPDEALQAAERLLRQRRFRVHSGDGWVSAEKGYLREVGNLLFHIALLALLFSVALGGIFGYKANRLLIVGQGFANTPTDLDVFHPGRLVGPANLQPFEISLLGFRAQYVTSGPEMDQPLYYAAPLSYRAAPGAPLRHYTLTVNHPLVVDKVSVYLIGHGYAPDFTITDGQGKVLWTGPVPFIPVNQTSLLSEGVIKVPDARPSQLGFAGVFLPTAIDVDGQLESAFPAALFPRVSLVAYAGNLGMNGPQAQSVYELDTTDMHRLATVPRPLAPGQSIKLPDGDGTLTFTGYTQWISLAITYDPGQLPALISAFVALAGLILSFLVRRRRVFVRAQAGAGGSTEVVLGGLARSDAAGGFEAEFTELASQFRAVHEGAGGSQAEPADDIGGNGHVPSKEVPAATTRTAGQDPAPARRKGSEP
ncbi:MAG TPA: cytochrome c biogenesis protein ResB [Streptosporangiaceae bacterium]|nr:cytochrome c biogenesis protein ResB [Streptosporangiaceae bacterium]